MTWSLSRSNGLLRVVLEIVFGSASLPVHLLLPVLTRSEEVKSPRCTLLPLWHHCHHASPHMTDCILSDKMNPNPPTLQLVLVRYGSQYHGSSSANLSPLSSHRQLTCSNRYFPHCVGKFCKVYKNIRHQSNVAQDLRPLTALATILPASNVPPH